MKKILSILLAVLVLGACGTATMDAKKRTIRSKARTTKVTNRQSNGKCSKCGGTGKVRCTQCHGKGLYEGIAYGDDDTYIAGCDKCGGGGSDYGTGVVRKGSGRMKCPACGGTGH